jgi:hypothetical protein
MLIEEQTRETLFEVWQPQACWKAEHWPFVLAMLLGGTLVHGDANLSDEQLRALQERRNARTIDRAAQRSEGKPGTRHDGHMERVNNAVTALTRVFNEGVPADPMLTVWRAFPLFSKANCQLLADRLIALAQTNAGMNNPITQAKGAA